MTTYRGSRGQTPSGEGKLTHLLSAMPSASAPQWATGLVSLISAQALEPKLKSMSVVDQRHETAQRGKVSYLIKEWSLLAIPFLS